MKPFFKAASAVALTVFFSIAPSSTYAGGFSDDEARLVINKLRKQVDEINIRINNHFEPVSARIDSKADKKSVIDMAADFERLRIDIAAMRNQIEELTNEVVNSQRRQKELKDLYADLDARLRKDIYSDLDARLRKLEPQRQSIDGKDAEIEQSEQKTFDAAMALLKASNYALAERAFNNFLSRYPDSAYVAQSYYWLGNTHFAQRDFANALPAYQAVYKRFSMSPKAADAMFYTASCQVELNQTIEARETLEALLKKYPKSPAAGIAKGRLAELK